MQPLPVNILAAILENLDSIVFPEISSPHARSTAKCTRILLNHLILRLEAEPMLLIQDSNEKRAMLAELASDAASLEHVPPALLHALVAAVSPTVPHSETNAGLECLTTENDRLKAVVEDLLILLRGARTSLGEAVFTHLNDRMRKQLSAQVERELSLVAPAFEGDLMPF